MPWCSEDGMIDPYYTECVEIDREQHPTVWWERFDPPDRYEQLQRDQLSAAE
jgi:hypothetical protein